MQRVLPSQAVRIIEETYPATKGPGIDMLRLGESINIGMLVSVIESIPEDLLPVGADRTRFTAAMGALRSALARWASSGHEAMSAGLQAMPAIGGHPVTILRFLLLGCPDEAPAVTEAGLPFITDATARRSIRTDMSNADRAVTNAEWKAATVLAGSVIEALLLWAVNVHTLAERTAAAAKWKEEAPGAYQKRVEKDDPESWFISDFIEIGFHLGEIGEATRKAARLAGSYRNLIHPGRVLRTGADATHGTALLALGAMREVARELTERHA